ncbi:MAG: tetratricopeptide repeat protein [Roseiflexaceae bacterium]|nr:tetratricopeptide repeat protein [Roseiflexaceae bacterium]
MKLERRPSIETTAQTPLGRLRAALDDAERVAVSAGMSADDAVSFLRACDAIECLLSEIGAAADIRPEVNRANFVRERLRVNAESIARVVQSAGRTHDVAGMRSWEAVQSLVTTVRARRIRRLAIAGLGAVALIAALALLLLIFPAEPAPDIGAISRLLANEGAAAALDRARAEYERFPDNPEAALWRGVLELRAGDPAAAEELFAQARQRAASEVGFLFERGNLLIQVGLFDAAEADAAALIARPDAQAEGHLLLGSVREARGDRAGAIEAFQQAADLAAAADKPHLEVIAKTRLGMILQSLPLTPNP